MTEDAKIHLELTTQEVNAILQVLGDLPTRSGAWPLIVKIKDQADAQVEAEETNG
tara:strand:- start:347 stop:511 length:165 start_codon:yes stop_codon:yes gene_type:complete